MTSRDLETTNAHNQVIAAIRVLLTAHERPVVVAIDGRSGSGKSTLAQAVAGELGAAVIVGDDFYSGGNDSDWISVSVEDRVDRVINWRRLREEVLKPLLERNSATWHPLDFAPGVGWVGWKTTTVSVAPADVVVVDGAYSGRRELEDLVDLSVLVEANETARNSRLCTREGEDFMRRWHSLWDAAEDLYFEKVRPPESFDIVVSGD